MQRTVELISLYLFLFGFKEKEEKKLKSNFITNAFHNK